MYTTLRYVGINRRRITWNSMGKCYSFTLNPGDPVEIPTSQINNAKAVAQLEPVKRGKRSRVKTIRNIVEEVPEESKEDPFEKQDKLDPFADVEEDVEVEIDIEDEEETDEVVVEEEIVEDAVVEEEPINDTEEEKEDTDFATLTKKELAEFLINDNSELKEYVLLKERKDTLIKMCVDIQDA